VSNNKNDKKCSRNTKTTTSNELPKVFSFLLGLPTQGNKGATTTKKSMTKHKKKREKKKTNKLQVVQLERAGVADIRTR
jgi:hypothetical protein